MNDENKEQKESKKWKKKGDFIFHCVLIYTATNIL